MINDTTAGRWFRRVMWLGIFANLALALPTIAAPDMMIELMRYPTATPALWPRFAGLLLVILSVFYTPAATDIDRYRIVAWFAIGSRAAGVLFFLPQATYRMLGLFDGVFLVPQLLLLLVAINSATGMLAAKPAGVGGLMPSWRTLRRLAFAVLVVAGTAAAVLVYERFFREEPAPYFASDEDHFLFGSVGTESAEGVPYWLWLVLPRVFPDLLPAPGGYGAVGFVSKDGHDLPVGLSKVTVGFPRVGINCAMCHAASYRTRPDEPPTIVAAAASHQTSPQDYVRFLFRAAADPRFNADTLLAEIARNTRLSFLDRLLYRVAIIPTARRELLRQRDSQEGWMRSRPDWGRGRIDPFNPVKFRMLRQPIDATIGNSDMVPVWAMERRNGQAYHWDGLNTSLREVVLSSALGDGATKQWADRDLARWDDPDPRRRSSLRRITDYLLKAPVPKYPYAVDRALAQTGAGVWATACAECHAPGGRRTGTIIPQTEVGTDRHRMDMWTKSAAAAYNAFGEGRSWKFSNFRSTNGYVTMPLDGLWLTGPFLHNGSVPSLADLLEPVDARPRRFFRGYDLYDASRVGFVTSGPEAEREGSLLDVSRPGNGNAGHTYGTELPAASKRALLEYMKTL